MFRKNKIKMFRGSEVEKHVPGVAPIFTPAQRVVAGGLGCAGTANFLLFAQQQQQQQLFAEIGTNFGIHSCVPIPFLSSILAASSLFPPAPFAQMGGMYGVQTALGAAAGVWPGWSAHNSIESTLATLARPKAKYDVDSDASVNSQYNDKQNNLVIGGAVDLSAAVATVSKSASHAAPPLSSMALAAQAAAAAAAANQPLRTTIIPVPPNPFVQMTPSAISAAMLNAMAAGPRAQPSRARRTGSTPGRRGGTKVSHLCISEGCTSHTKARGLCIKHGAYGTCSTAGCSTNAQARGLCTKHGAKGMCSVAGCSTNVQARGLCTRHGGGGKCSRRGCNRQAAARGLCFEHGAYGMCRALGCTMQATTRKRLCNTHIANKVYVEGRYKIHT